MIDSPLPLHIHTQLIVHPVSTLHICCHLALYDVISLSSGCNSIFFPIKRIIVTVFSFTFTSYVLYIAVGHYSFSASSVAFTGRLKTEHACVG